MPLHGGEEIRREADREYARLQRERPQGTPYEILLQCIRIRELQEKARHPECVLRAKTEHSNPARNGRT